MGSELWNIIVSSVILLWCVANYIQTMHQFVPEVENVAGKRIAKRLNCVFIRVPCVYIKFMSMLLKWQQFNV